MEKGQLIELSCNPLLSANPATVEGFVEQCIYYFACEGLALVPLFTGMQERSVQTIWLRR